VRWVHMSSSAAAGHRSAPGRVPGAAVVCFQAGAEGAAGGDVLFPRSPSAAETGGDVEAAGVVPAVGAGAFGLVSKQAAGSFGAAA